MKKIVIMTATRAEYGLLAPIIRKLKKCCEIDTRVVVTGTHLSTKFGMTINEIKNDGIVVDEKIEILAGSDTTIDIARTISNAIIGFAEYFDKCRPDALMVLGDRYETLAVCIAAVNAQIPIIHLYGGEATEGAIDELVRNAITKLSYLHFVSTENYRQRVIQMGESPERVYTVGAIGVENALKINYISFDELERSLGCRLKDNFAVLTFHPVTLENKTAEKQIKEILKAIDKFPDITFICTKANADLEGQIINECLEKYSKDHENVYLYDSLGAKRYLSALSLARFVIGNSSSGIIEAPSFKIPTINIGDRQKGRIQAESIINCEPECEEIVKSIETAISYKFNEKIKSIVNPYGIGNTSDIIVTVSKDYLLNNKLKMQKHFWDIDMQNI